jgi:hypothetical protein
MCVQFVWSVGFTDVSELARSAVHTSKLPSAPPNQATLLYSNTPVAELWKPLTVPTGTVQHKTVERWDSEGHSRVRGNPYLKSTQAYPAAFGMAVGRMFANMDCMPDGVPISQLGTLACDDTDPWDDASLSTVLRDLEAL